MKRSVACGWLCSERLAPRLKLQQEYRQQSKCCYDDIQYIGNDVLPGGRLRVAENAYPNLPGIAPMEKSWLSPKAARRGTIEKGFGIFALTRLLPDETIARWAGRTLTEIELDSAPEDCHRNCVQIGINEYLVPTDLTDGDYVNHCCDPNAGLSGDRELVALRIIESGEEISYDYAMTDTSNYDQFICLCGSTVCRGTITGADWRLPTLRERYRGYFSSYVIQLIEVEDTANG
jgi:hypothetical protein